MIFKLAVRNTIRHVKSSVLVILFMTAVGMVFMFGNSLLLTVNQSMKKGFRDNITGDLVIMTQTLEPMSLFGSLVPAIGNYFPTPVLKNKDQLKDILDNNELVESYVPLISGVAVLDYKQAREGIPFFGIDSQKHIEMFPGITILEGSGSFDGKGILISKALSDKWKKNTGSDIHPGDRVKLSTAGDTGFRIRSLEVQGIYQYPYNNPVIDSLALVDDQSARELLEVLEQKYDVETPEEASDLFSGSIDDFFLMEDSSQPQSQVSGDILGDLENLFQLPVADTDTNQGNWHFMLLRLSDKNRNAAAKRLEESIKDLPLQILDWRQAAGIVAGYAFFIQLFFYAGFFLIMITGVLGIVNIMLISLFQRTIEIGTIQALGADRKYIRRLFGWEYFLLTLIGGLLSIILSWFLLGFLNQQSIEIPNSILATIFGGKPLSFPFNMQLVLLNLAVSFLVGTISSIYPVSQALSIEPVEALQGVDR